MSAGYQKSGMVKKEEKEEKRGARYLLWPSRESVVMRFVMLFPSSELLLLWLHHPSSHVEGRSNLVGSRTCEHGTRTEKLHSNLIAAVVRSTKQLGLKRRKHGAIKSLIHVNKCIKWRLPPEAAAVTEKPLHRS